MIVPNNRLLFGFAAVVLPLSLIVSVEPSLSLLAIAGMVGFAATALLDAMAGRRFFSGVSVQLPEVVRMSKDREFKVELRIRNVRQTHRQMRIALALPREVRSAQEDLLVELPAASEWSRLLWPCVPMRRGSFSVTTAHAECASPLGFWAMRTALPATSEIRVYPSLLKDRKSLAALFLKRGAFGLHAQRQIGKGHDFEKLREYVPGDGYDEIHWKATARRGRPITKVFQIEKTQEIYVIIDASRLMARTPDAGTGRPVVSGSSSGAGKLSPLTPGDTSPAADCTLERFITAALVLGLAAEQQGDLFGLITFTNKVETFVRAKNGKAHYSTCRDVLYTLQPQIVSPDFDELSTFIRLRLRRRTLLFFLTALDDARLAESFVRNMELIRHQHLVLVNMVRPAGVEPAFSNPDVATVDQLYQHLGGHLQWQKLRELEKVLKRRGVRFSLLQNELLSAELVSQYLDVKRRQLL